MTLLDQSAALHRPMVRGDLPGPGSAALLARQDSRESNARVYGRHFPIAVEEASGSFVRDVDGNVFITNGFQMYDYLAMGTTRK